MAQVTPQTGHSGLGRVDVFAIIGDAGAKTFDNTPLFSFTAVRGFNRDGHANKNSVKITFEEYTDTDAIEVHIAAHLNAAQAAGKTVGEIEFDNGNTIYGQAASADVLRFGYIAYETAFDKVKISEGIGCYTGATGSKKTTARGANFYPIEISSVIADEDVVIPIVCYETEIVTAPVAAGEVTKGTVGKVRGLTAAA